MKECTFYVHGAVNLRTQRHIQNTHCLAWRDCECINQRCNNYTLSRQLGIRNCHLHHSKGREWRWNLEGGHYKWEAKTGCSGGKGYCGPD
ncbi:hypothetical protein EVAR_96708_1 [Eumeta japonica]|uniref:Uncharacterized protein n=1 Tax=Eumeta variegata TaxID=151549 RepID=A0A4C1WH28_EUMVA|nr:hypothetical protein EVAR_96708_1 [Eumeta japonica]